MAIGLLASFAATSGCEGCRRDPPPLPNVDARDGGLFDMVPTPKPEELVALWKRASGGMKVDPAEPFSLAYTVPTCSVRYELRSQYLSEVADGREPAGAEIVAELVGNPDTTHLTWQLLGMTTFLLHDGQRDARPYDAARWAPALVHTDGETWIEDNGPSTLWAAFSAVPPLVGQFPRLAQGAKLGEPYVWKVDSYDKRTTTKVEKRRAANADAAVPNFMPNSYQSQVTVMSWLRLEGDGRAMDVAVLEASWTDERKEVEPTESERAERWLGRYVVGKNGRLIHAVAMAGRYQWWQTTPTARNSKIGSAETELRLVEDCDSPTLPRFERP